MFKHYQEEGIGEEEDKDEDNTLTKQFKTYNFSFVNQIILLSKMMINFISITYAQNNILKTYDSASDVYDNYQRKQHMDVSVWVLYQVNIFYINIFSQVVFMIVSRVIRFRTTREVLGLGGKKRYEIDWLDFVKEDMHWFSIPCIQLILMLFALHYRAEGN